MTHTTGPEVVASRIGNWIGMPDGRRFYPLDPRPDEVRVEDIAHCLAQTCRWGGRCEPWYSVAQHSLHVMELVERTHPSLALRALLHDAAEAYTGDIVSPLKEHLAVHGMDPGEVGLDAFSMFWRLENRILAAILAAFGVGHPLPEGALVISHADAVALATEARDLMGDPQWPGLVTPDRRRIVPMDPPAARRAFLAAFERLTAREAKAS